MMEFHILLCLMLVNVLVYNCKYKYSSLNKKEYLIMNPGINSDSILNNSIMVHFLDYVRFRKSYYRKTTKRIIKELIKNETK